MPVYFSWHCKTMKDSMRAILNKISKFFDLVAKGICILSILFVFLMCIEQVFCRFVLHSSVGYVDELSRYLFILSCFVGSTLAVRDHEHFSLDILQTALTKYPKALATVRILVQIIIGIFVFFMIKSGILLANSVKTQYSSYLHLKMSLVYWLIPICGIWMEIYVVLNILRQAMIFIPDKESKGGDR